MPISRTILTVALIVVNASVALSLQNSDVAPGLESVSDDDGIPVLVKHLPRWESKRDTAVLIKKQEDLRAFLDERPVFEEFDFVSGTEAVYASYPEGKLLIVEFVTPQASAFADEKIRRFMDGKGDAAGFLYRRIGNYNVFIFDADDSSSADALFSQIRYEKVVQWLGKDPTIFARAEREFIIGARGLFVSTVVVIVTGLGTSTLLGIVVGFIFFFFREHRRAELAEYSDAGGMIRLNLDGLSPGMHDSSRTKR